MRPLGPAIFCRLKKNFNGGANKIRKTGVFRAGAPHICADFWPTFEPKKFRFGDLCGLHREGEGGKGTGAEGV